MFKSFTGIILFVIIHMAGLINIHSGTSTGPELFKKQVSFSGPGSRDLKAGIFVTRFSA
jgi:hypothetical protein